MDLPSYSVTYGPVSYGPWGPWSEWETWYQTGIRVVQYRTRWRDKNQSVSTTTYFNRCTKYETDTGYQWLSSRNRVGSSTEIVTIGMDFQTGLRIIIRPYRGDPIPEQGTVLGALHPGDRLDIDDRAVAESPDESLTLALDGEDLGPHGVVDAAELGVGHHFVDIESRGKRGGYKAQLAFNVTHSIEARFTEPVREITADLTKGPIGQHFTLEIRNDTESELVAYVEAYSVPAGWKALFEGEPKVSLDPWATESVELVAELMNDQGLREGLVPLTVEVRPIGRDPATSPSVYATCYARLEPKQPIEEIVAANEELRRKHVGKVYEALAQTS